MRVPKLRLAALALVSGIALSGCAYDMYGDDYGYGYGPYGGVGIGYNGYYGAYGYGGYPYGYGGYGYGGYGYDPFGWYGDYYYPGTGIYVYDRYRTRHVWNDDQRRYWDQRQQWWRNHHTGTTTATGGTENWSGWDRSHWGGRSGTSTGGSPSGWDGSRWQHRGGSAVTTTTTVSDGNWSRGSGRWSRGTNQTRAATTGDDRPSRSHWKTRGNDDRK